jgi:hypothetical protein
LKIEPNDIYSSLHKPIHKYNSRAAIRHLIRRLPAWVLCEGVALVNIVRKQEQVDLLTKLGAKFVVNSSSESFKKDLYKAIDATGAILAFEAIGDLDSSPTLLNHAFDMTPDIIQKYNSKTTAGEYILNPDKG